MSSDGVSDDEFIERVTVLDFSDLLLEPEDHGDADEDTESDEHNEADDSPSGKTAFGFLDEGPFNAGGCTRVDGNKWSRGRSRRGQWLSRNSAHVFVCNCTCFKSQRFHHITRTKIYVVLQLARSSTCHQSLDESAAENFGVMLGGGTAG